MVDTPEVLSDVRDKWTDGVHLSEQSLKTLAGFLSSRIQITGSTKKSFHAP